MLRIRMEAKIKRRKKKNKRNEGRACHMTVLGAVLLRLNSNRGEDKRI